MIVSDDLLTLVLAYGPAALGGLLMIGAFGAPLPGTFLLMAAGAFVREGTLDPVTTVGCAWGGTVLGDVAGFAVGRLGWRSGDARRLADARALFERWGGRAVFVTRFLLTPLGWAVNLLAGGAGYRFPRFLAIDAAGEIIWIGWCFGLGYGFAGSWEALAEAVGDTTAAAVGVAAVAAGVLLLRRRNHAHDRRAAADGAPAA